MFRFKMEPEEGLANKAVDTSITGIRKLSPMAGSKSYSSFIPTGESSLRPLGILSGLYLLGFITIGILTCLAWDAVASPFIMHGGPLATLGIIGAVMGTISFFTANPEEQGVGTFIGYYFLVLLIAPLFAFGVSCYFYESDTADYFAAKS
jgi:hypothetical protein